jgi:hypothetical protein
MENIYDQRGRAASKVRLLAIPKNKFHLGVANRALDEFGVGGGIHGNRNRAAQENGPEAGDPIGGVGTPEQDAVAWADPVARKRMTPKV